ncbi:hypothetical protein M0R04_06790 [Candidatus Dojkabacteria bacterium]|jgi:hypothetical protein|nr:hypothetical protein [Candidatus Dojkabacteria bacterium]
MSCYKLYNKQELIEFNEDCLSAVSKCPQYNDADPMSTGITTPEQVFRYWNNSSLLWQSGYSDYLSERAMDTFDYNYKKGLVALCTPPTTKPQNLPNNINNLLEGVTVFKNLSFPNNTMMVSSDLYDLIKKISKT